MKLNEICRAVDIAQFVQSDIAFLKEYIDVMAPVAASLDILQGEQNCSLGYVLPTLTVLKGKLQKVTVKHTRPLRDALLRGIDSRFANLFCDKEFLMAAVTHPMFKLAWIEDSSLRAQCTQMLEQAISSTRYVSFNNFQTHCLCL